MTTVLSQKGQLVLPVPVRRRLHLSPDDDFEVAIEDEDTITLRRVSCPQTWAVLVLKLSTRPFGHAEHGGLR